jgi:phospholipid-binding lipoprotein MlaA
MKQLKIAILFIHLLSAFTYADDTSIDTNDEFFEEAASFDDEFKNQESISDPLIVYNRFMTSVNDKAYIYILEPTSRFYATITPEFLRIGISNATDNIKFPIRFVNNLLQLKFKNSFIEFERFVINSTVGIGGLMDPAAKYMDLQPKKEDFGQTLGHYGIKSGVHIVLPLIGPSNIRDGIGIVGDFYLSPLSYIGHSTRKYKLPDNATQSNIIWSVDKINYTSLHLGEYESAKKDAVDWYLFLRNAYEEHRTYEISK